MSPSFFLTSYLRSHQQLHSLHFLLSRASSYTYLNLELSTNLSWSNYISSLVKEADSLFIILRRLLKLSPPFTRVLAYSALIRPKREHASSERDPYHSYLSDSIDFVCNRVSRYILSDYSYLMSMSSLKSFLSSFNLSFRR